MVLDTNGKAFVRGTQRRSFWNGPTEQHAVPFKAQVEMCPPRQMMLNNKPQLVAGKFGRAFGLGGSSKVALGVVFVKCHKLSIDKIDGLVAFCKKVVV